MSDSKHLNQEKINAVVEFIRQNPGCTKRAASDAVAKRPAMATVSSRVRSPMAWSSVTAR